jgi:hypothetical protein
MSKGLGTVERRVYELFASTRNRALSVEEIAGYAFLLKRGHHPTRAQRLSATRAAHRLLKRIRVDHERAWDLQRQAHANAEAAVGKRTEANSRAYEAAYHADPAFLKAQRLHDYVSALGTWHAHERIDKDRWRDIFEHWRATEGIDHRLYFHAPDAPARVWTVSLQRAGVIWADAEVVSITERNVNVRYRGEPARLIREKLWRGWAWWRTVRFVSSRTGRIGEKLDRLWQERYRSAPGAPPAMQMPLADAMALLGVPADYTREDVLADFRREAKKAHSDLGGTSEMFVKLVEARNRLLAALGMKEKPPKPPEYAPKGARSAYRTNRSGAPRLGSSTLRLAKA